MKSAVSIFLSGTFDVHSGEQSPGLSLRRKTKALLAYLTATRKPHRRQQLSELFCQESDDPARALRWHLSMIRQQLGPQIIVNAGETIAVNFQVVWVDVWAFEQGLQVAEGLESAVSLYRGELLAGFTLPDSPEFELWLLGERARLRQMYEQGLSRLVTGLIEREAWETAVPWTQRWVQSNPLLEEAHARLIWLYAQTGQRQAALEQFERCRGLLRRELAVDPTPELQALAQSVRRNDFSRLGKTAKADTTNLGGSADFVGRETELNQLRQVWQEGGGVVLVEAEAGGGKTRLVQEFGRSLPQTRVFIGRCYESTHTLPYHPWIEILETVLTDETTLPIDRFWLEQAARLLPSLALRLGIPSSSPPMTGGEVEQLFTAVYHVLRAMCSVESSTTHHAPRTTLLFLDDLQWADEISLRLFHFLAQRMTAVLFIGAFRAEETGENPALQTLVNDLRRSCVPVHLRLPSLTPTAVHILTAQLWPNLSDGFRSHVSQLLAKATGGNPLFLSELLRELAHAAELPKDLPMPPSLRELITHRLAQLPESSRQVIEAVAVLDAPFTLAQAQQTSARSEEEVATAVDLGLRWRLLVTVPGSRPLCYGFNHALMREAVMSQLSAVRCQVLHRRAAILLAQTAARLETARRQELAGKIVRHANAGQDFHLVWQWGSLAADYACRLFAYADALMVWETAVSALPHLQQEGEMDRKTAAHHHLNGLLKQIELLALLGRWPEEAALLDQAALLLRQHPDPHLAATFHLRRAIYDHDICAYEPAFTAAQHAYNDYLALKDRPGAAHALYIAGRIQMSLAHNREARRLLAQALVLYQAAEDNNGEALCLSYLAGSTLESGEVGATLHQILARARQIAGQQHDLYGQARACYVTALAWNFTCHVPPTRAYAQETLRLAQLLADEVLANRAYFILGNCAILENDIAQGNALYEQAFYKGQAQGDGWIEGWAAHLLGRTALRLGDVETAEQWLTHASQLRQKHNEAQNQITDLAWMGRLRLAQRDLTAGLAHTTEAIRRLEALVGIYIWDTADIYFCHAEALQANGRSDEAHLTAERAYHELMRCANQLDDPDARHSFFAFLHYARIVTAHETGEIRPYPG